MSGIYSDDKHVLGAELREAIGYPIGPTMTPLVSKLLDSIMAQSLHTTSDMPIQTRIDTIRATMTNTIKNPQEPNGRN